MSWRGDAWAPCRRASKANNMICNGTRIRGLSVPSSLNPSKRLSCKSPPESNRSPGNGLLCNCSSTPCTHPQWQTRRGLQNLAAVHHAYKAAFKIAS